MGRASGYGPDGHGFDSRHATALAEHQSARAPDSPVDSGVHHEAGGHSVALLNLPIDQATSVARLDWQHETTPCRFTDESSSSVGRNWKRFLQPTRCHLSASVGERPSQRTPTTLDDSDQTSASVSCDLRAIVCPKASPSCVKKMHTGVVREREASAQRCIDAVVDFVVSTAF